MKGNRVHWRESFTIWSRLMRWEVLLVNHLIPYIVNFYRGMDLLTKAEEKRFLKEWKILALEYSEGTEEEDNNRPRVPPQTTVRRPVLVDDLPTRERPEKRLTKRRKVMIDDEEELLLESRMAETQITGIWQSRTRARPKKKASRDGGDQIFRHLCEEDNCGSRSDNRR